MKTQPSRLAQSLRSHVSSFFIFDTFRRTGEQISWSIMFGGPARCYVIQLHGLEDRTEKAVTEFLLWDLYNYLRTSGPRPLSLYCVLDEAHKLAFDSRSPAERLLREARKFGLGLILASQQPEDFSAVAHANTASKLLFRTSDLRGIVAKPLSRAHPGLGKPDEVASKLGQLERAEALFASGGVVHGTHITSLEDRLYLRQRLADRWRHRGSG